MFSSGGLLRVAQNAKSCRGCCVTHSTAFSNHTTPSSVPAIIPANAATRASIPTQHIAAESRHIQVTSPIFKTPDTIRATRLTCATPGTSFANITSFVTNPATFSTSLPASLCCCLCLLLLLAATSVSGQPLQFQLDSPQACPQNPIRLRASRYPQFIYSPYDEHRLYPPDTDCQFLIEASTKMHRIHLNVLDSELEEALFTECNDYVAIRDREGNETNAKEVVRWCGQDYPAAVTSSSDSLLIHFHSDSVIQKRGFNISVVEFELPNCPPGWESDSSSPFCYKQFVLPHILPWVEAQKECTFERANLATFQSDKDYAYIAEAFSQTHSFPWIGYSDANLEGTFETADRSSPLWPENFPLRQENEMKDCVFLDWNKRDQVAYEIDDCRNRRPFLCKKKKDGTEVPVVLPAGMIRRGFRDFSIDYTILIVVVVGLLLLLVVACLIYHKFKERNNRVVNVDLNQRLVGQQQSQQGSQGSGMGGSRNLLGTSSKTQLKTNSAQKAAAAAALAKEKEREKQYATTKNSFANAGVAAAASRPPLESQESVGSFPLQQFQPPQMFAADTTAATMMDNFQMRPRDAVAEQQIVPESDESQSPRIRLSPNQPEPEEEETQEYHQRKGTEEAEEAEEEEDDRHNLGYEPDSEEGEEETARGSGKKEAVEENGADQHVQPQENGGEGGAEERGSLHGEFARGSMEALPVRPEIAPMLRTKERKKDASTEETQTRERDVQVTSDDGDGGERETAGQDGADAGAPAAVREDTMFSAGQQTLGSAGTSTRLHARRKSFDKPPPVGPLDNVSAISLDEFWQKDA